MTGDIEEYKRYVRSKLNALTPVFAKASIGEFSDTIEIPDENDEFTDLYAGVDVMLEVIKSQLGELRESESRYRNILDSSLDGIVVEDKERLIYANRSFARIFGYDKPEEVIGMRVSAFRAPEDNERMSEYSMKRLQGEKVPSRYEFRGVHKDGRILELEAAVAAWSFPETSGIVTVMRDITERKKAEKELKDSLIVKEVLLKEIHHRVKNNTQMIASLLSLQSKYIKDKDMLRMITDCQNRIRSMALIHESFYRSEDLSRVFGDQIRQLVKHLFNIYGIDPATISFNLQADRIHLDIDTAVSCGLLINEIVSNSLKHAFPDGRKGEIMISLCAGYDRIRLTAGDNGVGLPEDIDTKNPNTMGMQVIKTLCSQLGTSIVIDRIRGTKFTLEITGGRI